MTKNQATVVQNVRLRKRVIQQEYALHSALMDCGYSVSRDVESTCTGTIIIDIAGSQRLLGSPMHIGQQLTARAAQCGFKVHVAFATNPDTALYAARGFPDITVIEPGQEARRISPLPIEVLQLDLEPAATLDDWGIRNFELLSKLPIIPLVQRLGPRALYLQQLAQAKVNRKLIVSQAPARFQESIELDEPLELLEPIIFVLSRLLQQLISRLTMRSLATDKININLQLEHRPDRQLRNDRAFTTSAASFHKTIKIPVPTQDASILLKLLHLHLAEHPPIAPVKKVTLEAVPASIRFVQCGFFKRLAPEPAKLEVTVTKLHSVMAKEDEFGRSLVGFPKLKDSHKPDSVEVMPSPWNAEEKNRKRLHFSQPRLRRFSAPLPLRVELNSDMPSVIVFKGRRRTVSRASGPWHTNSDWWNATEWNRSEWDIELHFHACIGLYRIFHDHQSGKWFVKGIYD
jgi:protein ImuB